MKRYFRLWRHNPGYVAGAALPNAGHPGNWAKSSTHGTLSVDEIISSVRRLKRSASEPEPIVPSALVSRSTVASEL